MNSLIDVPTVKVVWWDGWLGVLIDETAIARGCRRNRGLSALWCRL